MHLPNIARLDPLALARHLEIPVLSLSELRVHAGHLDGLSDAVDVLQGEEQSALSAVTVFRDTERLIVYNDSHGAARRASDLTHEVAHGLLLHQPTVALGLGGCRAWDGDIENEASFLGGALLIPGKAARWSVMRQMSVEQVARRFGCSPEMVNWRWNESGARRLMRATR
jgi:Zn-dependent peptidase ImmA (M78 family)